MSEERERGREREEKEREREEREIQEEEEEEEIVGLVFSKRLFGKCAFVTMNANCTTGNPLSSSTASESLERFGNC
jgi:hypothetical protein